jgi:hypothetical protein
MNARSFSVLKYTLGGMILISSYSSSRIRTESSHTSFHRGNSRFLQLSIPIRMSLTTQSVQLSNAALTIVGGNQISQYYLTDESTIEALKPAERRRYYVPGRMPATREHIFTQIDIWLKGASSYNLLADLSPIWRIGRHREQQRLGPNIIWISGSPGSGKSAIISSLVSKLTREGRLGSSFFKRRDAILEDLASFWRTVAFDLANSIPLSNLTWSLS